MNIRRSSFLATVSIALTACAGATRQARVITAPPRVSRGEEFRIVGRADGRGEGYDAMLLFERANAAARAHRCDAAIADYERLAVEFGSSTLVPTARFNQGVCQQSLGHFDAAATAYRAAAGGAREPTLARDAWFRLAVVGEAARQPPVVLEATQGVLATPRITIADQVEAHARRATALLAQGNRAGARHEAEQAGQLVPSLEAVAALGDDTYIAQARFVAAETWRLDAADVAIVVDDAQLEAAIERRVQRVTHAHVLFNEAIRVGNPHWAAACGYAIGEMYRGLYDAIVNARTPDEWDSAAIEAYRRRTGQRLRPLLQGALRAWEATLAMARRNAIGENDWVRRTDAQITELRELILRGSAPAPAPGG